MPQCAFIQQWQNIIELLNHHKHVVTYLILLSVMSIVGFNEFVLSS